MSLKIVEKALMLPGELLFEEAKKIRDKIFNKKIYLRAIIEFSNVCVNDCAYCGIRRSADVKRYAMKEKEIVKLAQYAEDIGYGTIVLQSGQNSIYDESLCEVIREIKETTSLAVTLSCGEKSFETYKKWKESGADRYLLKQETSNPELFRKLTNRSLEKRFACLKALLDLSYETGSGNIVGLPGQKLEDIAKDIITFAEWNFDMLGIGPFIPCYGTPLENCRAGDVELTMKVIAISRIVCRDVNIPATTALRTKVGEISNIFDCGANVVMGNVTPYEYKKLYRIYPGKICVFYEPESWLENMKELIKSCGLKPSGERGSRKKGRFKPDFKTIEKIVEKLNNLSEDLTSWEKRLEIENTTKDCSKLL